MRRIRDIEKWGGLELILIPCADNADVTLNWKLIRASEQEQFECPVGRIQ